MTAKNLISLCIIALISQSSAMTLEEFAKSEKRITPGGWERDGQTHFDNGHITLNTGGDTKSYYVDYRTFGVN